MRTTPHNTTVDFGGRFKLYKGFVFLFMAGRSFSRNANGQPEYLGYFGIQALLSKYGRALTADE
jgi:hypothetical protein